jgi:hypothetical protein
MSRKQIALVALTVLLAATIAYWLWPSERFPEEDISGDDEQGLSADLPADLKLMWQTQPLGGTPDPSHGPNPRGSTDEAIKAAYRVFHTVELVGKTKEEVVAILGDPRASNDSVYNFPFWPAPRGGMVYRFDTGAYGWQFNLYFDWSGKVRKVTQLWIH